MIRVVVLGATGMLGAMVTDVLSRDDELEVIATHRRYEKTATIANVRQRFFEASRGSVAGLIEANTNYIINCVGVTKPYIRDGSADDQARAIWINSLVPYMLDDIAQDIEATVLTIGTDCVYSGTRGGYMERDPHDAMDVYGRTKSLGEAPNSATRVLRTSIIGPEVGRSSFLLEWLRGQPQNATLTGYSTHAWNGITTLAFAKIVRGIIKEGIDLPSVQHLVPGGVLRKDALLKMLAGAYGREDLTITSTPVEVVNRVLKTAAPSTNTRLWQAAGYERLPAISELVTEQAAYQWGWSMIGTEA